MSTSLWEFCAEQNKNHRIFVFTNMHIYMWCIYVEVTETYRRILKSQIIWAECKNQKKMKKKWTKNHTLTYTRTHSLRVVSITVGIIWYCCFIAPFASGIYRKMKWLDEKNNNDDDEKNEKHCDELRLFIYEEKAGSLRTNCFFYWTFFFSLFRFVAYVYNIVTGAISSRINNMLCHVG